MTRETDHIETGERLAQIETTLEYIKKEQDLNKGDHAEIKKMIKDFTESADKKYASKTTESLVYGLVTLILLAFVGAIIKIIIIG